MSCLGVHFALTDEQAKHLLTARSGEEALMILKEETESEWDEEWLCEAGKAWDTIHRCLTDGRLESTGNSPLSKCILGGRQLYDGSDYIVSFLDPAETNEVFLAIKELEKDWLRQKYFSLDEAQVGYVLDEDDFDATWSYFEDLKDFFQKASREGRAVVFTVDQ